MTVDFKTIGKRIKVSRTQRDMTQAELSERVGVSNVYISNIETGVKGVSLEVLLKIAGALGVSLDSMVFGSTPIRLPKVYREFAELLADCDVDERELILKNASSYKKMLRVERG